MKKVKVIYILKIINLLNKNNLIVIIKLFI